VAGDERRVVVRSYRLALDQVDRRIFKIDRWRLPTPHGVSVRSIVYAISALGIVALCSRLPGLGAAIGGLPPSIPWLAIPVLAGWLLSAWRIDGRPPHRALGSLARYALAPKAIAGVRPCRRAGGLTVPVAGIAIAAADDRRYRRGVVRGPARLTLCYPARVEGRRGRIWVRSCAPHSASRLQVIARGERPLRQAKVVRVPVGGEVRFG
jgi:hypothetical protein